MKVEDLIYDIQPPRTVGHQIPSESVRLGQNKKTKFENKFQVPM